MAIQIDLSNLGDGGTRLLGGAAGDRAGFAVAGGSDVNGDGFLDIVIGAPDVGDRAGAAYVVFGSASGFANDIDLGSLGDGGLTLSGLPYNANSLNMTWQTGSTVAMPGDVNNDGVGDLLVGNAGNFASTAGIFATNQSYLIFGDNALAAALSVDSLGANGLVIGDPGATGYGSSTGSTVSGAGDLDNDGVPDIALGAAYAGLTYVVYGDATLGADLDVATQPRFATAGVALAGGGDVNGDGFDDLIIGSPGPRGDYTATVVFGGATRFAGETAVDPIGTDGFRLTVNDMASLGRSVAILGDVNGDDIDDFAIVLGEDVEIDLGVGTTFVFFGRTDLAGEQDIHDLSGGGFRIRDTYVGAVASAGDFNGDGLGDILVRGADGAAYVVFGRDGDGVDVDLSSMTDQAGVRIAGAGGDFIASSLAGIGDVNGDGFDDILIGASLDDAAGENAGAAHVVYGFSTAPMDLAGTDDADTLEGFVNDDTLAGGAGDDMLLAGSGDDSVDGGDGNDTAYGQDGDDLLSGGAGNDSLFGNTGNDNLGGGDDDDVLRAQVGNDTLAGDDGGDDLFGGGDDDMVDGGAGDDTVAGNSGADTVSGGTGNDTVRGQGGDDSLEGGDGDDLLVGMQGFDVLSGGAGNDTLIGGAADDTLTGGAGSDAFVFATLQGADTVTDFTDGTDVISLIGVSDFAALTITDTADGAVIVFEDTPTTSITLTGITAAQLTADDFFFS